MAVDASPGAGRVLIATGAGPLVSEPSWTRFDDLGASCRCFGFDWQRGRQSEFDVTNTGTARVFFHDRNGTFDDESLIGLQAMLQIFDPVAEVWEPVFRGHIDDIHSTPSPGAPDLTNIQMDLVGPFDYVSGVKMVVGQFGDTLPDEMSGVVWYDEASTKQRIEALGVDANLHTDMLVVFDAVTGVWDTLYDPDDDILSAMRDAADAEFPGIGNIYEDRYGRIVFHGRYAKFDPDTTASGAEWNFQRWAAATREDVTTGRAQIREFQFNRPRTRIVNTYVSWPERDVDGRPFIFETLEGLLTKTDASSIAAYGYRGRSAPSLILKENRDNSNTGVQECELFGEYYVSNYAEPRKNVERITVKSLPPDLPRAEDCWAFFAADISDVVHLFVDEAGLSDVEFFIEGISGRCRPGAGSLYDSVTFTPNLSPAAYYTDNVFDA